MRPLIGIPCQGNLRTAYRRFCVGQSYCRALEMAGGAPVLIPLVEDEQALLDIYQRLDGLLLAGGGDIDPHHFRQVRMAQVRYVDPPRDRVEMLLVRRAVKDDLPVLAICRGIQVLNVALGGTLYQDIPSQIPYALRHNFHPDYPRNHLGHEVEIKHDTRLAHIVGSQRVGVNSFHHQAVKEVAPILSVAAFAPDGVIEAVEAQDRRFVLGVQWHPEELVKDDPRMMRLFEALIEASVSRSQQAVLSFRSTS